MKKGRIKASISDCSTYDVELCEREKTIVFDAQSDLRKSKGTIFSIPATIRYIIGQYNEYKNTTSK